MKDLLERQEQVSKEQTLLSSMSLYRLPAEGMAQIKDGLSPLKDPDKTWICPVQLHQKSFTGVFLHLGFLDNFRNSQVGSQEYPSQIT